MLKKCAGTIDKSLVELGWIELVRLVGLVGLIWLGERGFVCLGWVMSGRFG